MPSNKYPGVREYTGKTRTTYYVKFRDANGKQVEKKAEGATSKREAAAFRRDLVQKVEKERWVKPNAITFAAYADEWLPHHSMLRDVKASSTGAYRTNLKRLKAGLGTLTLDQLTRAKIDAYRDDSLKTLDSTTVSHDLSILSMCLKRAVSEGRLHANPVDHVDRPKKKRPDWRILSPVEVSRCERAFTDERARLIFVMQSRLGLRRGETQQLRWRDLTITPSVTDGDARFDTTLRITKAKTPAGERSLHVPASLAAALGHYRETATYAGADEYVFAHPRTGGKFNGDWYSAEFKKAREAAGVEGYMRPCHDTRHTAITNMAAGGTRELPLMAMAGHSSPAQTAHYLHLAQERFPEDVEALDARYAAAGLSTNPSTDPAVSVELEAVGSWPEQNGNGPERP